MSGNNELPLRLCTGIVLLNNENKVFVGKRIDQITNINLKTKNPDDFWQMPQGGIDKNEIYQTNKRIK